MRTPLLFLFIIGMSQLGFSQAFTVKDLGSLYDLYQFEKSEENLLGGATYEYIQGSPYLNEEFTVGDVIMNDSLKFEEVPLRYNTYNDKIEFRTEKGHVLEISIAGNRYRFLYGGRSFVTADYIFDDRVEKGILEQLTEGDIALYKKRQVELKPATKAIGYKEAQPDRFVILDDRYLLSIGNDLPKTFRNKKKLFQRLVQLKPDIEEYAKKQKLNPRSEDDLIKIVHFCNE